MANLGGGRGDARPPVQLLALGLDLDPRLGFHVWYVMYFLTHRHLKLKTHCCINHSQPYLPYVASQIRDI